MANRERRPAIRCCCSEACRTAHAKCDTLLPSCARCATLKYTCDRGLLFPFRHGNNPRPSPKKRRNLDVERSEFDFSIDQVWVPPPPPGNVEFIIETGSGDGLHEAAQAPSTCPSSSPYLPSLTSAAQASPPSSGDAQRCRQDATPKLPLPPPPFPRHDYQWPSPAAGSGSLTDTATPADRSNATTPRTWASLSTTEDSAWAAVRPRPPQGICPAPKISHWPITDEDEAKLLRHFVADLSLWFDYCDPQKTFATSVIQRVVTSPTLLYAILATSARHLSTITGRDAHLADRYHRKCLALLIPILDDENAARDEALYAATVILRVYEEISVPLAGRDLESHLMGTHTFVRAQDHCQPTQHGIRQAAFLIVLRQEIILAFRTQRPVQLLREYTRVDRQLTQAKGSNGNGNDGDDDWAAAFHIIVVCAEVLTFCHGDEAKTPVAWEGLADRAQRWMDGKAASFEPILRRGVGQGAKNEVFPDMWLLNDCHVAAYHHYYIAQILLAAHDPRGPQLGPGRHEAVEASNALIRAHVRNMCGIALSNQHCIPAMFTASMVIGICGDLFTDYKEQRALLDMLIRTDVELAWPTAHQQAYLKREWGWS